MSKLFFTSDTHFGHQRTFNYSMRSMYFKDVKEMNDEMVRRWNATVSNEDIVYHLGDFGDFEYARKLNGRIVLLYGNYEREKEFAPDDYQKHYFEMILKQKSIPVIYKRDILNINKFQLVHEPENYTGKGFYLFGHIHEKQKVKKNGLNVGVDVHNFTPVSEETVEFYRNAIENIYDDNCFLNY